LAGFARRFDRLARRLCETVARGESRILAGQRDDSLRHDGESGAGKDQRDQCAGRQLLAVGAIAVAGKRGILCAAGTAARRALRAAATRTKSEILEAKIDI